MISQFGLKNVAKYNEVCEALRRSPCYADVRDPDGTMTCEVAGFDPDEIKKAIKGLRWILKHGLAEAGYSWMEEQRMKREGESEETMVELGRRVERDYKKQLRTNLRKQMGVTSREAVEEENKNE